MSSSRRWFPLAKTNRPLCPPPHWRSVGVGRRGGFPPLTTILHTLQVYTPSTFLGFRLATRGAQNSFPEYAPCTVPRATTIPSKMAAPRNICDNSVRRLISCFRKGTPIPKILKNCEGISMPKLMVLTTNTPSGNVKPH